MSLLIVKLAIHLSFLAFRHVCALFCELFHEIGNQSLYTSHNIANFVHLWFCEKLDEKLSLSPLRCFMKIPTVWWERQNARWEKWLARWCTKCHLYTYRFSHFTNIFSHSRQIDKNTKKMLAKREVCRWHFVNCLANHFFHLMFRHSRQAISIFTKHQRWMESEILWEMYSDWFAISQNSSWNSAWTYRNTRNDKCIASLRVFWTIWMFPKFLQKCPSRLYTYRF